MFCDSLRSAAYDMIELQAAEPIIHTDLRHGSIIYKLQAHHIMIVLLDMRSLHLVINIPKGLIKRPRHQLIVLRRSTPSLRE